MKCMHNTSNVKLAELRANERAAENQIHRRGSIHGKTKSNVDPTPNGRSESAVKKKMSRRFAS
ncbi:hypothetical protein A2U01_0078724, partial [Trifolium medium]|nr:hypothetical protein [Trifolium medium]